MTSETDEIPQTRENLYKLYNENNVSGFHVGHFPKGHAPTNYNKYFTCDSPYEVNYSEGYEPYVIVYRKKVPR